MPIQQRDDHSGAIFFVPSPEEEQYSLLVAEVEAMKKELGEKLEQLDKIIESYEPKEEPIEEEPVEEEPIEETPPVEEPPIEQLPEEEQPVEEEPIEELESQG